MISVGDGQYLILILCWLKIHVRSIRGAEIPGRSGSRPVKIATGVISFQLASTPVSPVLEDRQADHTRRFEEIEGVWYEAKEGDRW